MSDAQNNPEFAGYDTFVGEFRNRDYRFISCCMSIPDRTIWSSRPEDGRQLTQTGNPYPEALFPKNNEVYDGSDPAYGSPSEYSSLLFVQMPQPPHTVAVSS